MHKCVEEAVLRVALRNDLVDVVKGLHDFLSAPMHLEYAFYVTKQVLKRRSINRYDLINDLLLKIANCGLASKNQQICLLQIQRSAAFIILMRDIAGLNDIEQTSATNKQIISRIKELLPHTNKFGRLDDVSRESRIALMLTMMKKRRIHRLRNNFHEKAERMSQKMEERLDRIRADLLPPLDGLPLENYFENAEAAKILFLEITKKEGISEKSLTNYLRIIEDSPQMSVSFFNSSSCEVFPFAEEGSSDHQHCQ